MKKLALFLALVLFGIIVFSSAAFARYSYIESIGATLSISNGIATCSGTCQSSDSSTTTSIKVELKQKIGTKWETIESWSGSGNGKTTVRKSGTKSVSSGYSYKVVTTGTIKDSNGKILETDTKESPIKTY